MPAPNPDAGPGAREIARNLSGKPALNGSRRTHSPSNLRVNATDPYDRFIGQLREALSNGLPGADAQLDMAPSYRSRPADMGVKDKSCREAAVLALFYPDVDLKDEPSLLLTLRPRQMSRHAGQVAFPGGRRETGEELVDTALRETEEEVLIDRTEIDVLGALTPLFIPPTEYCVYPFVGSVTEKPDMTATSDEVERMFGVPAAYLLAPDRRRRTTRRIRDTVVEVPCFALNGQFVWGATAMMLSELARVLERIGASGPDGRGVAGAGS
jgi:8-oxo-dGTP pyrophosphatase MutT (NUDIX family)